MKKDKILFVAPRFHTNQFFLTKNLIDHDFQVNFLSIYLGGSENHEYVDPIVSSPSRILDSFLKKQDVESPEDREKLRRYHFTSIAHSIEIYKKCKPDIVIIRNLRSLFSIQHFLFGLLSGRTVFLYTQNDFKAYLSFKRRLFYKILGFIGVRHITPVYGNPEAPETPKSVYLPFVIDPMVSSDEVILRERKQGLKIVTIGKLVPRKNILELLRAIKRINSFSSPENELIIISECRTDDQLEYYKLLEKEVPGADFKVTFQLNKTHQEVLEILKSSDLFILPSVNEPAAFSILEAMACGLGVICTESNGTKCYVEEGINGNVFTYTKDLHNIDAILNQILDQQTLITYGLESLRLVRKNHNVRKFIEQVTSPS